MCQSTYQCRVFPLQNQIWYPSRFGIKIAEKQQKKSHKQTYIYLEDIICYKLH